MKKAFIEGICCDGCARDVAHILSNIYGVTDVSVDCEHGFATFEGFVSKEVVAEALAQEGYRLISIEKAV
jgi:copper chaperone CopZ